MTGPKLPCVCGCPAGRHLMGKRDCRSCQTCSEYEPAESQPVVEPVLLDVTALLGEVQGDVSREAELAARLADVEQQLAKKPTDLDWAAVRAERDRLHEVVAKREREIESLRAQLVQAEAYASDLQAVEGFAERLYDTHIRHLCTVCGARYREFHNHPCGPLVPVRVRITFIEE